MKKNPEEEIINVLLTLDRIETDKAVLVIGEDEMIIPKKFLPRGSQEGDCFNVSIMTEANDRKHRERKAKDLLNEILKGEL